MTILPKKYHLLSSFPEEYSLNNLLFDSACEVGNSRQNFLVPLSLFSPVSGDGQE
ncbi:hypothetical protein [Planktothrix mougeotii]|uniref:Uncharacterized protein n=1 Tax=Planktothrix mougeotii LEGE 06226 TaxID=1828728 RepID=A0ABR9UCB8_9CYAN|nr:hypothetical protein [Planktothrix mougeotii]MBE9144115.1 hypothetical protein [Planktothrix mougeotii LEGE 06226]